MFAPVKVKYWHTDQQWSVIKHSRLILNHEFIAGVWNRSTEAGQEVRVEDLIVEEMKKLVGRVNSIEKNFEVVNCGFK